MTQPSRRMVVTTYSTLLVLAILYCIAYAIYGGWTSLNPSNWSLGSSIVSLYVCTGTQQTSPEQQAIATLDDIREHVEIVHRNVAIASFFGYHFDVYMALAGTFHRVITRTPGLRLRVFADKFVYDFEQIILKMGLHDIERHATDELLDSLRRTDRDVIDLLILGTCEFDLLSMHTELLAAWDERPADEKFDLVCMVHNTKDEDWQVHIPEWAARGSLRFVTLGDHVGATFKEKFDQFAESKDIKASGVGFESIAVDAHYPVLDIPNLHMKAFNRTLSKAVIQGAFESNRRDYNEIFTERLFMDPAAWGYHSLGDKTSFVPDYNSRLPPFFLSLVGSGSLEVPPELDYMVTIYRGLDYKDFYKVIADVDIVMPAFSSWQYYREQASSTVALAVELDVPILATNRMRKAYGYIDDDRVVVTRPAAMREVQALKALRTGDASFFLDSISTTSGRKMSEARGMKETVQRMLNMSYYRRKEDVTQYKQQLWRINEILVERLLRNL